MTAERSPKQVTERRMSDKERALADYPPYKDFIRKIGGPDNRILPKDTLSLRLRLRISEIQAATGLQDEPLDQHVRPLLGVVDGFYAYRENETGKYTPSGEPSDPKYSTAHEFFVAHSMGTEKAAKLTEKLDQDVLAAENRAATDDETAELLKELGGADGYRSDLALRGAYLWVSHEIGTKFTFAKQR